MKTKDIYENLAIELAKNKNEWKQYLFSLARYYKNAFLTNLDIFFNWQNEMKRKDSAVNFIREDWELIREIFSNYIKLYEALPQKADGSFEVNYEILDKFEPITDQIKINKLKKVNEGLKFREYEIMNETFTIQQLMNATINFYKNFNVRKDFFKKIISEPRDKIDELKLSKAISFNNLSQNSCGQMRIYAS